MSTKKTILVILASIGGLGCLVIAACAGIIFTGYKNADHTASPRVDALFAAMENNTVTEFYDNETTQEFRNMTSKESFVTLGELIQERLGKLQSKSLRSFNSTKQLNFKSTVEVGYRATFEKGDGSIHAKFRYEMGSWKLYGFEVTSPKLGLNPPVNKNPVNETKPATDQQPPG